MSTVRLANPTGLADDADVAMAWRLACNLRMIAALASST